MKADGDKEYLGRGFSIYDADSMVANNEYESFWAEEKSTETVQLRSGKYEANCCIIHLQCQCSWS